MTDPSHEPLDPSAAARESESQASVASAPASSGDASSPSAMHIYILVAGLLIGVLLGPGVLGRIAPDLYGQWFLGGADVRAEFVEARQAYLDSIDEFEAVQEEVGASVEALREKVTRVTTEFRNQTVPVYRAREQAAIAAHEQRIFTMLSILVGLVAVIMVLEAVAGAGGRSMLVLARYGLIALWIAVVLAAPHVVISINSAISG